MAVMACKIYMSMSMASNNPCKWYLVQCMIL